jgi:hypothetical protein
MNERRGAPVADPPGPNEYPRSTGTGYREPIRQDDEFIERMSWLMDRSIPLGGGYSIGLDGILGLIPGVGDFLGAIVSSAIIYRAQKGGIPRSTVLRMVANVGIDAAVGAVPVLGDLFDFAFKANTKNLQLYRESIAGVRDTRRDTAFLVAVLLALGAIVAVPVALIAWLMAALV